MFSSMHLEKRAGYNDLRQTSAWHRHGFSAISKSLSRWSKVDNLDAISGHGLTHASVVHSKTHRPRGQCITISMLMKRKPQMLRMWTCRVKVLRNRGAHVLLPARLRTTSGSQVVHYTWKHVSVWVFRVFRQEQGETNQYCQRRCGKLHRGTNPNSGHDM